MKLNSAIVLSVVILLVGMTSLCEASDLRLARYFSDDMVLQRDKPALIRGFAKPGAKVVVRFGDENVETQADDHGRWATTLPAMAASSEGRDLSVTSQGQSMTIRNVAVGDVILIARQSSIDVSLDRDPQGQSRLAALKPNPDLRVLNIKTIPAAEPQEDLVSQATQGWSVVNQQSAARMSVVAYELGRELVQEIKVPVGIIDLNMGRNFTLGWIDIQSILNSNEYYGRRTRIAGYGENMQKDLEKFRTAQAESASEADSETSWIDPDPLTHPLYPAAGYNAVLNPLRDLPVKAVVLQLGNDYPYLLYEALRSNGKLFDRAVVDYAWWPTYIYRKQAYRAGFEVLPRVPFLWREYFGHAQLPLAFVMPPSSAVESYAVHHREIRELLRQTAEEHQDVGLIVADVEHVPFSGQPADDSIIAERALSWLRHTAYGQQHAPATGPWMDRVETNFNTARVYFKEGTADGLKASGHAMDMFEVAAVDRAWYRANAEIDGETIKIRSDDVDLIAYVRYNYSESPDYGLTNAQGLPAIPFRTGEHPWVDRPARTEILPPEYTTPAREWTNDGIAIVSGGGAKYRYGSGVIGPAGFWSKPFGPNMKVTQIFEGSPADGKLELGDMIYAINGQPLGDNHLQTMGAMIAHAESHAGQGKLVLSLRRNDELLDVALQLEVLGKRSSTSPYNCPKTEKIIANSEAYLAAREGLSTEYAFGGFLFSDSLFLLGAGSPEHQGLVRRFIYKKMAGYDPQKDKDLSQGSAWEAGHAALLFGEYYLATGDRNVLPYLKLACDRAAAMQARPGTFKNMHPRSIGGWRHKYPGGQGYGMIPQVGLGAMLGMTLAREAGVEIDDAAYERGLHFIRDHQAEMGFNDYASIAPRKTSPENIDPRLAAEGKLESHNGRRGMAATLFSLMGDTRIAHLNSLYCAYAWNTCEKGHGSNVFNSMWTPIGANLQGKPAFVNFMKHHAWFHDLKRMYDHGYLGNADRPTFAPSLGLLVPRQRLRILGAPPSVFGADAPEVLAPSLQAFFDRNYDQAIERTQALLDDDDLSADERAMAEQLIRRTQELQESIRLDLAKLKRLIESDDLFEAGHYIRQLRGVMPEHNPILAGILKSLEVSEEEELIRQGARDYKRKRLQERRTRYASESITDESDENWIALTTQQRVPKGKGGTGVVDDDNVTIWRAQVVEAIEQAPENWTQPAFDDSQWLTGELPFSWHLNHTLIARTHFDIEDVDAISALRISTHCFRQQNIVVYLNGKMVAMFNQCGANKNWVHADLTAKALQQLRDGQNTLAFTTTNSWRWATRSMPEDGGFGLVLKARKRN